MEQRETIPRRKGGPHPAGPHPAPAHPAAGDPLRGFAVSYTVGGPWNVDRIREDLFDSIGPITPRDTGFSCTPDEFHPGSPEITVDAVGRTVGFGLFGSYRERDVAGPILQAANEFARRYEVDLEPFAYERWELRPDRRGYALVERLPLGSVIHQDGARIAHA